MYCPLGNMSENRLPSSVLIAGFWMIAMSTVFMNMGVAVAVASGRINANNLAHSDAMTSLGFASANFETNKVCVMLAISTFTSSYGAGMVACNNSSSMKSNRLQFAMVFELCAMVGATTSSESNTALLNTSRMTYTVNTGTLNTSPILKTREIWVPILPTLVSSAVISL